MIWRGKTIHRQLDLPLGGANSIYVVPADDVLWKALHRLIEDIQPAAIIDLRHFSRYDFQGADPRRIREYLSTKPKIIKKGLPLHEMEINPFKFDLRSAVYQILRKSFPNKRVLLQGPILILVQNQRHARLVAPCISEVLKQMSGHAWAQEILTGNQSTLLHQHLA